jgi:hypothetical protein
MTTGRQLAIIVGYLAGKTHDVPVELELWKIKINLIVMDEKNVDLM